LLQTTCPLSLPQSYPNIHSSKARTNPLIADNLPDAILAEAPLVAIVVGAEEEVVAARAGARVRVMERVEIDMFILQTEMKEVEDGGYAA
jgi:hypothetical protein